MAIDIPEFATDEEKLLQIIDYLEELKEELGNIVDEMDADGRNVDFLDEGLDAIDDAALGGNRDVDALHDTRAGLLVARGVDKKQQFISLHVVHLLWASGPGT